MSSQKHVGLTLDSRLTFCKNYCENFNDVDIAYSDLIQRITQVINKIAHFKEIRIKKLTQDWFDGEILDKIILRDKRVKKFKAFRLNIDE